MMPRETPEDYVDATNALFALIDRMAEKQNRVPEFVFVTDVYVFEAEQYKFSDCSIAVFADSSIAIWNYEHQREIASAPLPTAFSVLYYDALPILDEALLTNEWGVYLTPNGTKVCIWDLDNASNMRGGFDRRIWPFFRALVMLQHFMSTSAGTHASDEVRDISES